MAAMQQSMSDTGEGLESLHNAQYGSRRGQTLLKEVSLAKSRVHTLACQSWQCAGCLVFDSGTFKSRLSVALAFSLVYLCNQ